MEACKTLHLNVETQSGKTFLVKIRRQALVSELKLQLEITHGIECRKIIFNHIHLKYGRSLMKYNITNESVLQVEGSEAEEESIKKLGEGGFGVAYLIKRNGKHLVNKQINLERLDAKGRQLAIQEMQLLEDLNHPNIVSYQGGYMRQECLHILMEYCAGEDLRNQIRSKKGTGNLFMETKILMWIEKISEGLKYIHDRKIIHRDIKPENIFLSSTGTIKIGDFGVAKVLHDATHASTVIGTRMYMAPEVGTGRFTTKADIFALGCVMYELAKLEFANPYVKVILHESFSENFKSLIASLVNLNPNNRPDASEVLANPLFMTDAQREVTEKLSKRHLSSDVMQQTANTMATSLNQFRLKDFEEMLQYETETACLETLNTYSDYLEVGYPVDMSSVLQEIIFAMKNYHQNLDIQHIGSSTLAYISREEHKSVLTAELKCEIESVLLTALKNHSNDDHQLLLCCMRLIEIGKRHQLILKTEQIVPKLLQLIQMTGNELRCLQIMSIIYLITYGPGHHHKKIMNELGTIKVLMNVVSKRQRENSCKDLIKKVWDITTWLTADNPHNCEAFLAYPCLPQMLRSLSLYSASEELQISVLATLGNISVFKDLRPQLLRREVLEVLVEHLSSNFSQLKTSEVAAKILIYLLSDGNEAWSVATPGRAAVMQQIVDAIDSWDMDSAPPWVYTTLKNLWILLEANHTPVCQYWAIWIIAKFTRLQPDRYCPMMEEEGGIKRLQQLKKRSTNSLSLMKGPIRLDFAGQLTTEIVQLTLKILNSCKDYREYKELPTMKWNLVEMLFEAASDGEQDDVEELVRVGVHLNSKSLKEEHAGFTALHVATEKGHIDVVCTLLINGGSIHYPDKQGRMAIHIAAWGGHTDLVKLLYLFGANPKVESGKKGWKPVHFAAARGHLDILKYLEGICDIKSPTRDQKTALHLAAKLGRENVVSWLLERGLNIHQKDAKGLSALDYATQENRSNIILTMRDC